MEISEKTFPLFEMIRNDGDVNVYINEQNKSMKALHYTEHSLAARYRQHRQSRGPFAVRGHDGISDSEPSAASGSGHRSDHLRDWKS